jgi:predicted TIM-barrel enzyme
MSTFSVEIPGNDPVAMGKFQEAMNEYCVEMNKYIAALAAELGISDGQAAEIIYLRERSRWSQVLEDRLLQAFKAGHNIVCNGDEEISLSELGY